MTADVPETSSGGSVRVVLVADPGLPPEIARASRSASLHGTTPCTRTTWSPG
ncbi:hypothetical protein [Streptomyces sp. NPDC003480]